MKILMIDNICSVGWNLTQGLRNLNIDVVFVGNKKKITSGIYNHKLSWKDFLQKKYGKDDFDIVHIHSPNFKKLGVTWKYLTEFGLFFKESKLICHWHGSDLRIPIKAFPVYTFLKKVADYNLYSTIDLAWWLKNIDKNKKEQFTNPINTKLFEPYNCNKKGIVILSSGAKTKKIILHDDMPIHLNKFKALEVYPYFGLSDKLLQVSMLEGASCGLNVINHKWLNRNWVIKNASIESQTKKLLNIYNKVLK